MAPLASSTDWEAKNHLGLQNSLSGCPFPAGCRQDNICWCWSGKKMQLRKVYIGFLKFILLQGVPGCISLCPSELEQQNWIVVDCTTLVHNVGKIHLLHIQKQSIREKAEPDSPPDMLSLWRKNLQIYWPHLLAEARSSSNSFSRDYSSVLLILCSWVRNVAVMKVIGGWCMSIMVSQFIWLCDAHSSLNVFHLEATLHRALIPSSLWDSVVNWNWTEKTWWWELGGHRKLWSQPHMGLLGVSANAERAFPVYFQ